MTDSPHCWSIEDQKSEGEYRVRPPGASPAIALRHEPYGAEPLVPTGSDPAWRLKLSLLPRSATGTSSPCFPKIVLFKKYHVIYFRVKMVIKKIRSIT
uniref:Uncharacterized protein n=1 Tax=Leptospirillum sp. Group II '5-way CG' TaxID=419541 RepID=B6AQX7_9BACT|nr:MAG: Hypothetical protein CGL2_10822014 [Leptospirillum sp. Group II '5-way CG']